jgi:uncharacterized protein YdeI (YjbR/CyaY-like superfamily)
MTYRPCGTRVGRERWVIFFTLSPPVPACPRSLSLKKRLFKIVTTRDPRVDHYFVAGCGRCPLGNTPDCKALQWLKEFGKLRTILLRSGLTEDLKWGVPCYTLDGRNVVLMSGFKEYCALNFLKGALLQDPAGILQKPGESSQSARYIRFRNVGEVTALLPTLKAYLAEAIALEAAGAKVTFKKNPEPVPAELQDCLDSDPALAEAFNALTPGRQRGYILFFSAPKQSATRYARIEKWRPAILAGKGMHD